MMLGLGKAEMCRMLQGLKARIMESDFTIVAIQGVMTSDGFEMRALDSSGEWWALKGGPTHEPRECDHDWMDITTRAHGTGLRYYICSKCKQDRQEITNAA